VCATTASLKCFMIYIVRTSTKRKERTGRDYDVLLYTVVAGTWGVAAGCLCNERLGERERTLYFHIIHNSENIKKHFLK
jgi:hypothetical protein